MRVRLLNIIGLLLTLTAIGYAADDPFSGTWRDVTASLPENWELLVLAPNGDGITLQGNGQNAITHYGKDYLSEDGTTWNTVRVDDHTLKSTFTQDGKIIANEVATVSPDGKHYTRTQQQVGSPRKNIMEFERVGSAPKGDAFFGVWKSFPLIYTIRVKDDAYDFMTNRGSEWKGQLDGKEYTSPDDGTKTQARRTDGQTIELRFGNRNSSAMQVMILQVKGNTLTRTLLRETSAGNQGENTQRPTVREFERIK